MNIYDVKIPLFIITFLLGLLPSLFVSIYKYTHERYKYNKFKNMLVREYVDNEYIRRSSRQMLMNEYSANAARIKYLINNELKFIKYNNQISYIRFAEFTIMYMKEVTEIIEQFVGQDLDDNIQYDLQSFIAMETVTPELINLYKHRYMSYVNMHKDTFLTNHELESFKQRYLDLLR